MTDSCDILKERWLFFLEQIDESTSKVETSLMQTETCVRVDIIHVCYGNNERATRLSYLHNL